MTDILNIHSLKKSYNHIDILSDISININRGKIIGILGDNGSGKSTFLKIIAGIVKPNKGSGNILGLPLFNDNFIYRKHIFYWGHEPLFYPDLTGKENIELFLSLRNQEYIKNLINDNIINHKMEYHINRIVREYSFGQIKKLKLILCIISNWELGLFDEPISSLDHNATLLLEKNIEKWKNNSKTLIITSHNKKWLETITDEIFILKNKNLFSQNKND